jgi:predicted metal-dependent phosphoesterase TrpH
MNSLGDFHSHSTYSDGRLSPTALVDLAAGRGVRWLALTDHDITDGIPEAEAAVNRHPGMSLIHGVELSTDVPGNEVHVLGYFLDWHDPNFQATLAHFRESRLDRGVRMVERLAELGMPVSWERVKEIAGEGAVGRPHIAQALVEQGHVASIQEAFDLYLSRNGSAYVERERMTPVEAVSIINSVNGIAALAHPRELQGLDDLLDQMCESGLAGMEVFYKDYLPEEVERLRLTAERHNILPLGGSDYHALQGPGEKLPGDIPLPPEAVERFLELAKSRGRL